MISLQSNEKMLTKPNGKSLPHGKDFPFISLFQERQTNAPRFTRYRLVFTRSSDSPILHLTAIRP